ncbi:MAG TPA: endonuclease III [Nitrolancea sp.]|nr:endonuclease III [Nitrolancea sp.]
MPSKPFDIRAALTLVEEAIQPFPPAMLFELAQDGHDTPFEQLVACMISIRTRDEVSLVTARALFGRARTPREMAALEVHEIDTLIHASSFHEAKAAQIHGIAERALSEFDGQIPCDAETLMSFKGVGLKCSNLVLGIACNQPRVAVDIHVHRITNRWGYVKTKNPERTSAELEAKMPHELWIDLNRLLVPFGKHICTGTLPKCSTCPLLEMCAQVGVERHR